MSRARTIAACAVAAALAASGALVWSAREPTASSGVAADHRGPASAARASNIAWVAGSTYRYDVALRSVSAARVGDLLGTGDAPITADVDVGGALEIRALGEHDGGARLALRFGELLQHKAEVLGTNALADRAVATATLCGHEAIVTLDAHGAVRSIATAKGVPPLFPYIARAVVAAFSSTMPDAPGATLWRATEPGPSGRAQTAYRRDDENRIVRTTERYAEILALPSDVPIDERQTLDAVSTFEVIDGTLRRSDVNERLVVRGDDTATTRLDARTELTLRLVGVERGGATTPLAALDGLDVLATDERPKAAAGARDKLEENLVVGMTMDALLDAVTLGGEGQEPGFFARAAVFARRRPEELTRLLDAFKDETTTPAGRAFVLDLLASAGSRQAQAIMRQALSTDVARRDPKRFALLLQSLTGPAANDPETTRYLREIYADAKGRGEPHVRFAAAHSLAASARRGRASSAPADRAAADGAVRGLLADLHDARGPEEKHALVAALGNAHSPEVARALHAMARTEDASTRDEIASALSRTEGPEARAALLDLATDSDGAVASTAVRSLGSQALAPEDMRAIAALVTAGKASPSADGDLVTLVGRFMGEPDAARAILDAVLAHPDLERRLELRARRLRAQL